MTRAATAALLGLALAVPFDMANAQSSGRAQQGQRAGEVTIENRGNQALNFLYVAPITEGEWGDDRLGSETISPNQSFRFRPERAEGCTFDIRAVFADGRQQLRLGVNLCRDPRQAMAPQSDPTAEQLMRQGPVVLYGVRNATRMIMQTLKLVSPDGEESDDVLGSTTVAPNRGFVGRFAREDGCSYTLVATFDDGGEERRIENRDLCRPGIVVFERAADTPPANPQAGQPTETGEQLQIAVENRNTITINNVYIRATGTNAWGPDRLGSDVVSGRATYTIRMSRERTCNYDVRAVYDGNRDEVRQNVNLCETPNLAFTGPAVVAGRGQAKGQPNRGGPGPISNVTVINENVRAIRAFYISSSRVSEWGEDRMPPGRTIAPSGGRETTAVERDDQCSFDLRVVYEDGREETRMRQNICTRAEIFVGGARALVVDGGGPEGGRRFVFSNDGRGAVREIYLTPVSDTHWGDDRLGSEILPRRHRFELRVPLEAGCRWDMRLVYEGGRSAERRDQNLCAAGDEIRVGLRGRGNAVISTGTGFFIAENGQLLTNHHVIDGCTSVAISRPDGARVPVTVVASDEGADLALLRQDAPASAALSFRDMIQSPLRPGERVVLVGYPARSQLGGVNVTEGIVSGTRGALADRTRFQYTAPTQPGNSGGPVMDATGNVIGVVVAQIDKISGERTAQNINFGIQIEAVRKFLADNRVDLPAARERPPASAAEIFEAANAAVVPLDCLD